MIEFTVGQSALTCQWGYKDTFISLPAPGDDDFFALYKVLLPYGAGLSSMSYEEEPENLAEDRLIIPLFNGRLRLRLAYGGFDFLLSDLYENEEFDLGILLNDLSSILKQMGADIEQGTVRFIYEAFIFLNGMDSEQLLDQHLTAHKSHAGLIPDTFAYQIKLRADAGNPLNRLVIARSTSPNFPSALYVHLTSDYATPGELDKFTKQVISDWHQVMASLDLKLLKLEDNHNATK